MVSFCSTPPPAQAKRFPHAYKRAMGAVLSCTKNWLRCWQKRASAQRCFNPSPLPKKVRLTNRSWNPPPRGLGAIEMRGPMLSARLLQTDNMKPPKVWSSVAPGKEFIRGERKSYLHQPGLCADTWNSETRTIRFSVSSLVPHMAVEVE